MSDYKYTNLAEIPSIKDKAAEWFHSKWGVPKEAYLECMDAFLNGRNDYGGLLESRQTIKSLLVWVL